MRFRPLFSSLEDLPDPSSIGVKALPDDLPPEFASEAIHDYRAALRFLRSHRQSQDTFTSYRRELERLYLWSWYVAEKHVTDLWGEDMDAFMAFVQKPPKEWLSESPQRRQVKRNGDFVVNPNWRPFMRPAGKVPKSSSLVQTMLILESFYGYLIDRQVTGVNPVRQMNEKAKFKKASQDGDNFQSKRLSPDLWDFLRDFAVRRANEDPSYEHTLFVLCAMFYLKLRVGDLVSKQPRGEPLDWERTPLMKNFRLLTHGNEKAWWFYVGTGKGNKSGHIAVSEAMFVYLQRWRKHLGLTPYPSDSDETPLIPSRRSGQPIRSTRALRYWLDELFSAAVNELRALDRHLDAHSLEQATTHWMRHTGISEDIRMGRDRDHVREDARHGTMATTDRYVESAVVDRYKSAQTQK